MAVAALSLVTASVGPAAARGTRQRAGASGRFDYYVLSLSWSPQHCAQTRPAANDPQCAVPRRFGFVAHGLWPQYERGYPSSCATGAAPDAALVDGMLDIMPSPTLVRHEWAKHGSCSGLDPAGYFATLRRAFRAVQIPERYRQPTGAFRVSPAEVRADFRRSNRDIDDAELAVLCSGPYLQEVRICFDRDLRSRACGRDVRDRCRADAVTVRPVR